MTNEYDFFKQLEEKITLNEVQTRAVKHLGGPLLLLASPGSGKTTTIIARIGYLIQVKELHPRHILAVSFSKASAQDLLNRFNRLFPDMSAPYFSTIHSLAFKIMSTYLKSKGTPFQIIEGDAENGQAEQSVNKQAKPVRTSKLKLLSQLYEQLNGERAKEEQLEELTTFISLIKNRGLVESEWASLTCSIPNSIAIFERYEQMKQHHYNERLIDYDDMLTIALFALEHEPELLHLYQSQYRHILTDESQDTSLVQHQIISLLVKPHQQLFVVADDDQAIYSWRGADVTYLLQFKQHYPEAEILFLQQNYRSTKKIVRAANVIIKQNKSRYTKVMFTDNSEGQDIVIEQFSHAYKEVSYIAEHIQKCQQLSEVAVLYRNHISTILLMNELDKRSIPFYMKDADDRFFKHWVIQDILNILRLSYSDKHFHVFEAVAMKLQLYISYEQINRLKNEYQGEPVFAWLEQKIKLEPYQRNQLYVLQSTIPLLKDISPKLALVQIREHIGYNKVIKQLSERLGFKYDYLMSILDSLELISEGLNTLLEFVEKLKHLEQVQQHAKKFKGQQAVTLSTLHSAKGLEFNTVFMMDLIEGVLPSRQDTEQAETMEEAVRLFYVGMTRARQALYLLSVEQWFGQKVAPTRFVRQLQKSIVTTSNTKQENVSEQSTHVQVKSFKDDSVSNPTLLVANSEVEHIQFGRGRIVHNDGTKVKIEFVTNGVKTLLVSIVIERGILKIIS